MVGSVAGDKGCLPLPSVTSDLSANVATGDTGSFNDLPGGMSSAVIEIGGQMAHWVESDEKSDSEAQPFRNVVMVVMGALFLAVNPVLNGPSLNGRPFSTVQSAISVGFAAHSTVDKWSIATYITKHVEEPTGGLPEQSSISCPTVEKCYVLVQLAANRSIGPLALFYRSNDGGTKWNAIPLPAGTLATSPLQCLKAEPAFCMVGAQDRGIPVLLISTDSGRRWSHERLPAGAGLISSLSCTSRRSCVALLGTNYSSAAQARKAGIYTTADGGDIWIRAKATEEKSALSVSCAETTCVATGSTAAKGPCPCTPLGFVLYSKNRGQTWALGTLPNGLTIGGALARTYCVDSSYCWTIGILPSQEPSSDADLSFSSAVAESQNGGITWALRPLPQTIPRPILESLSCPTRQDCWVAGGEAVPQVFHSPINPSKLIFDAQSPVIVSTHDGGDTWTTITFSIPRSAPVDPRGDIYFSVVALSCPTRTICVGIGPFNEDARQTPVYSDAP